MICEDGSRRCAMPKGTIKEILDVGASIVTVVVVDEEKDTVFIKGEGRLTTLALEEAFGSLGKAIGQVINYELTDFGLLVGFTVDPEAAVFQSPQAPIVHLYGTSGEDLMQQLHTAIDAAEALLTALAAARPHGRDYYTSPDQGAHGRAVEQATAREAKVSEVMSELKALRRKVAGQMRKRSRT
jgi:hypothetical protein